jgi:hypothetical protein
MTFTLLSYLIYLGVGFILTFLVGIGFYRSGKPLLHDIFRGEEKLAEGINRLLLMIFYLLTIGYISVSMYYPADILSVEDLVEHLSVKIGTILLVLGALHLLNILVLFKVRRKYASPTNEASLT